MEASGPARRQPGLLSGAPPWGCPHKPSHPTKGQCPPEGRCCVSRMAAGPARSSRRSDHRELTRPGWLGPGLAGSLFVFVDFEPVSLGRGQGRDEGRSSA